MLTCTLFSCKLDHSFLEKREYNTAHLFLYLCGNSTFQFPTVWWSWVQCFFNHDAEDDWETDSKSPNPLVLFSFSTLSILYPYHILLSFTWDAVSNPYSPNEPLIISKHWTSEIYYPSLATKLFDTFFRIPMHSKYLPKQWENRFKMERQNILWSKNGNLFCEVQKWLCVT